MKRFASVVVAVSAIACSTRHDAPPAPVASAPAVVAALRVHPAIARHLDPSARLAIDGARLRLAGHGPGFFPAGAVGARVSAPTTGKGAARFESTTDPDRWVEIDDPSLHDVGGEIVDGAVVFREATRATDVVMALEPGRLEESRLVRARDAASAKWRLRLGPALASVRIRDGVVEVLDRDGRVFVESSKVVAWDARGVRYDARLSLEHVEQNVVSASFDASDAVMPLAIDPLWNLAANMASARGWPAAAALSDGRVLVVGGSDGSFALSTTEIFNPTSGTWSAGPNNTAGRNGGHFAIRLLDGKVLVGGGTVLASELYDPGTNSWSPAGSTITFHGAYGAVLHPTSGKVYVAGTGGFSPVVESWDPTSKTWTRLADMNVAREGTTLTVLPGGAKILAAGSNDVGSTAELYDIASNTWSYTTTTMTTAHVKPLAFTQGGKVHIVGAGAAHDVYDPASGTWTAGSPLSVLREPGYAGGLLSTGKFFIAGGYNSDPATEIWNPTTGAWSRAGSLSSGRYGPAVAPLPSDRYLVVGGYTYTAPVSTAEIFQLMANGTACTLASDCASGFCVDGVCCNSACNTGACVACNVSTSMGTCTPVTSGAPHGTRTCAPYASCVSPGACATTCGTAADCTGGNFCNGGSCVPRKTNGTSCSANEQCVSNACVDGVCCNRACAGQCESCSRPTSLGTCTILSGAPAPDRPACPGTAPGTTCGHQCNGTSPSCVYPTTSTSCSGPTCAAGVETHLSICDGAGKCSDVPKSCGAYVCGASACLSSCTTNAQCATGFYCASGACVPVADLGKECSTSGSCSTGHCVDGVCCGSASCDAGSSCANPGKKGSCSKSNGTSCASDAECGSAHCVDGVCCDTACDGQCEACDVTGRVGRCFPVSGKPHGLRTACDSAAGDTCKARTCDGAKDTTACVGFASGPSVECAPASCAAGTLTEAAYCDGAGTCRAPTTKSCAPFACDASGKACRTTCSTKDDCSLGNTCQGGACVPGATCSPDGLSSITKEGTVPCAPYRCRDGACPTSCGASSDCAGGFACDASSKCVAPQTESDGGGCAFGTARAPSFAGLLLLATGLLARRRQRNRARELV